MRRVSVILSVIVAIFSLLPASVAAQGAKEMIDAARRSESPVLWCAAVDAARESGDTSLTALALVSYAQALQNMEPADTIVPRLTAIVAELTALECHDYAFAADNVLIDRLFSDRRYDAADKEAEAMYDRAVAMGHPLGMAMALRVQGQMAYKMQLYDKALDIFTGARSVTPGYRESLNAFSTGASIDEWIWMTSRMLGDNDPLAAAAGSYNEAVDYRLSTGWDDPTGHFRVTAAGMQALAECRAGCPDRAFSRLDSARILINPSLPSRAYEQYYLARALVAASVRDYDMALACADTLMATHRDYYPFYLNDMLLKAQLLDESGRHRESVAMYRDYIQASDSVTRLDVGRRLDELRMIHGVETARLESERKGLHLVIVGVVALLIAAVLAVTLVYMRVLRRKNRLMVTRLEEYDRMRLPAVSGTDDPAAGDGSVIARLDRYMLDSRSYCNPALSRRELADAVGVKEQQLTAILREERGMTVMEYIAVKRLDEARHMLVAEPDMSLTDIAAALGFGTIRTFQRVFHKRYGMPPSEYRRRSRESATQG